MQAPSEHAPETNWAQSTLTCAQTHVGHSHTHSMRSDKPEAFASIPNQNSRLRPLRMARSGTRDSQHGVAILPKRLRDPGQFSQGTSSPHSRPVHGIPPAKRLYRDPGFRATREEGTRRKAETASLHCLPAEVKRERMGVVLCHLCAKSRQQMLAQGYSERSMGRSC